MIVEDMKYSMKKNLKELDIELFVMKNLKIIDFKFVDFMVVYMVFIFVDVVV